MKTKTIFITGLFLILGMVQSFGQTEANPDNTNSQKQSGLSQFVHNDRVALKLDYFGELVLHPGMSIGIDYTLTKKRWITLHWDTDLGGYWHRWNHTALFLKSGVGARLPISSFFVDLNLGVGYMHSFAAGTIYQRVSDGGIEKAANWGHAHFMPNSSFLIGWDGTRKMNLPLTVHIGVEAYLQSSFNHLFLPHAAAKVGITYKFKK